MISSHPDSFSSSDLIDGKLEQHQMSTASKQCPNCGHKLDQNPSWVGLPSGVKFDPTDQELMEHLEAKVSEDESKSHPLIDGFIPIIEGDDGICYTHPEKLPGVTRDGLSKHFFHRPLKAYTTGTRKRRKIQTDQLCDHLQKGETRWHKTGKTRPVLVNGKQKGCKKILVLYTNFGKNRKPEKTNWVMHQYHLGELEEEKEGELVVSKIFYQTQPRQCNWSSADKNPAAGEGTVNLVDHKRKRFDEGLKQGSIGEATAQEHVPRHEETATASFNISRPTNSISSIIPPPLHQSSMVLDDHYHVSRILQQRRQQQKLVERSSSGLEELIMGCTSAGINTSGEPSIQHPQETEWIKYSFWSTDK